MNKNNSFVAIADSSNKLADISAEFEIGLQIFELTNNNWLRVSDVKRSRNFRIAGEMLFLESEKYNVY